MFWCDATWSLRELEIEICGQLPEENTLAALQKLI